MKEVLQKSDWGHQNTALSIHGPMTLDVQSSFKLKKGQLFLKSKIFEGERSFGEFLIFVDNEANEYKLSLGGFNGTKGLGDSFVHSNNAYFSTVDVDNDNNREDCEGTHKAGWWFHSCIYANLNGVYIKASKKDGTELSWFHWGNTWKSLKSAKMMIRPRQNA
uniref:Fibrinogen C-terminal domain-containing protein n=1 Tax=Magallana gigas TaxID=29159 RepID=A0A8W8I600_MAGGI